jgi:hypothetical protein
MMQIIEQKDEKIAHSLFENVEIKVGTQSKKI